ncbi:MAG: GNAT family N-acetyltransferase, partial [Cyanobacteria bacterium P01_C01_bin.73]
MVNRSVQSSPLFQIRTATLGDLGSLSNLLTTGFYRKDGWTKWLYPLIRLGIHEDLKARLSSRNDRYACLMAVYSASSPVTQASATQASVTQTSVTQAPVTGTLHQKNVRNSGRTDANHIVGTVEISCRPNSLWLLNQPRYLYLSNLTVDTQFRRQGAAQQLLNACEAL